MKTRNILERRIEESYNRYKKLYREQQAKGFSLEKMKSKKEYAAIYKDNIGLGRKNIANFISQSAIFACFNRFAEQFKICNRSIRSANFKILKVI